MNRLEYISLLEKTLVNISNETFMAIEMLKFASDSEFEENKIEYINSIPFPSAIRERFQALESCIATQVTLISTEKERNNFLNSQLFIAKIAYKAYEETFKAKIEKISYDYNLLVKELAEKNATIKKLQKETLSCTNSLIVAKECNKILSAASQNSMESKNMIVEMLKNMEKGNHTTIRNIIDEIYGN